MVIIICYQLFSIADEEREIFVMKSIKYLILISIMASLFITILPCYAAENEESKENKPMVYVTGSEQETLYNLLLQNFSPDYKKVMDYYSLTFVKDSITRVYTVDLFEYAETGDMNVKTLTDYRQEKNKDKTDGNVYAVKLIDSNQKYGGSIIFSVEDNFAYNLHFWCTPETGLTEDAKRYKASCSYADHAVRIKSIVGKDELVSANDVKYIFINRMGYFFYIESEDKFITQGYVYVNPEPWDNTANDYSFDSDELKIMADRELKAYQEFVAKYEQWKKEHPGEPWTYTGDYTTLSYSASECSKVDNIVDIAEYLGIDFSVETPIDAKSEPYVPIVDSKVESDVTTHEDNNNIQKIILWCCVGLGVFAIIVSSAIAIVHRKKSKG